MDREYEFFVTTQEPRRPNGKDRGRVRRVVMRNFVEAKGSKGNGNGSEKISNETVEKKGGLKARFRLEKPGRKSTEVS